MAQRNKDLAREKDVQGIVEEHRSKMPEDIQPDTLEVRLMSDEEQSLEARLERSLTPAMRECIRDALKLR